MISAGDLGPICSKRKAITVLFPYAIWQEQDGQHKVFDVCLHAARASKQEDFLWYHIRELPVDKLLNGECPVSKSRLSYLCHLTYHGMIRWMGMYTGSKCGQQQPQQFHIQMRLVKV
jgi:hypothetical protein